MNDSETYEQGQERIAHNDRKFAAWPDTVNKALKAEYGFGIDDLPDYLYADDFENGTSPLITAQSVLIENNYLL